MGTVVLNWNPGKHPQTRFQCGPGKIHWNVFTLIYGPTKEIKRLITGIELYAKLNCATYLDEINALANNSFNAI